jgi:uncharacterized protein
VVVTRWRSRLNASPSQRAGRILWRLGSFVVAWILVQGIVESLAGPLFAVLSRAAGEPVPMYPFTMLAGAAGGCWAALRFMQPVPWTVAGFSPGAWHPRRLLRGFAVGAAAILLVAALLWLVRALHVERVTVPSDGIVADSWSGTALRLFILLAPAALWEELAFRGFLYGVANEAAGRVAALATSSVAFGAVHLMNPGAGLRTTLIVMVAGWALALVREQDGLPAAWIAHLAWNWIMAAVLHVPVSGLPFATPGYRTVIEGPDWMSGGSWGPEGSLLALVVLGGAAGYAQRRGTDTIPHTSSQPRS